MSVPPLRFQEFEDEWKMATLGKLSTVITSGSRDWSQYYSSVGPKFIRMTNLPRDGIDLLLDDLKYVSLPDDSSEGLRTLLQEGDVLISITAELGKIGLVPRELGPAYINQHNALVRPSLDRVSASFLAQHLATKASNKRLNRLNDSGAKSGLNLSTVRAFKIFTPSLPEQKKIAAFLGVVDAKITALRAKVSGLETYKRGLMQVLFDQRLRFTRPNDTDFPDWEEKKLGEVANIRTGKKDVNEGNPNGKYPFFTCAKAHTYSDEYSFDCDAILIAGNGEVGHCQRYSGRFEAYQRTYVLSDFEVLFDYAFAFLSNKFTQHVESLTQMGAMPYIRMATLSDFSLPVPHPDEQQKIADALSALDAKIQLASAQVSHMETFKKGLLQQMFL